MDIHPVLLSCAVGSGFTGMIFSFNVFSAVATWCMFMCLFETGHRMLELAACLLAGFVYHAPINTLGVGLYTASYAFFLLSLPHQKYGTPATVANTLTPAAVVDTSVQVDINGDDI